MFVSLVIGEVVYQAHRFRRTVILSPVFAMGVAAAVMTTRNWHHIQNVLAL